MLFAVILIGLFAPSLADSFTNGFAIGYVSSNVINSNVGKSQVQHLIYNYKCLDTSSVEFPPDFLPQCKELKTKIQRGPIGLLEKITVMFILFISILAPFYIILFGTDKDRSFLCGIYIGAFCQSLFNDD
tara:strand:- start:2106 stop:2495 length:390 start_codon:yes stop_codon:yes gene_type:complete